jgi:hypothetical protein
MPDTTRGKAGPDRDRGAVTTLLAAVVAAFLGGVLAVVAGVTLPARVAPEATTPVNQVVTNYNQ